MASVACSGERSVPTFLSRWWRCVIAHRYIYRMIHAADRSYVDGGIAAAKGWPAFVRDSVVAQFGEVRRLRVLKASPELSFPPGSMWDGFGASAEQIGRHAETIERSLAAGGDRECRAVWRSSTGRYRSAGACKYGDDVCE
jgi:hypothetical protein